MLFPRASNETTIDYSDDGPGMLIGGYILTVIATVFVGFRIWARRLTHMALGPDDYLILAALVMEHGIMAASTVSIKIGGIGRDVNLVAQDPEAIVILYKSLFVSQILYALVSGLIKLAVLTFYWRVFPTRTVQVGCIILGTASILWVVAVEIATILQCLPVYAFWTPALQLLSTTKCINTILFLLANSILNTVIDLATIILPVGEILKLQVSRSKKWGVCGIFLLGGITFAASLARTISTAILYKKGVTNFTKEYVTPGMAAIIEIYVAIIGACLPILVPVYNKLRYNDPHHKSATSKGRTIGTTHTTDRPFVRRRVGSMGEGSFERLDNSSGQYEAAVYEQSHVSSTNWNRTDTSHTDIPLQGIAVKHEIVWTEGK